MAANFPELIVRDYRSLIDALAAQKNALGISDAEIEAIAGMAKGHWSKCFAKNSRTKNIGPWLFGILCEALSIEFVPRINVEAAKRVSGRYTPRAAVQVRNRAARLSTEILELARPIILSEMARKGWQTRQRRALRRNGHTRA